MPSPLFENAFPSVTAIAVVAISLVFGLGCLHATSSSTVSESPTTTSGWLQKGINRLLIRTRDVKTPSRSTPTATMIVHTEQQGVIRRRTGFAAAARANLSWHNTENEISARELSAMEDNMVKMKASIRELQEDTAENRRDININRAMLSIHHEKHVQSDLLHDASNKRHTATEGEVKVLQKDVKGLKDEKELLALSVAIITTIMVALVVNATTTSSMF